ncbi:unnamed protein product [Rotaria magnacalcarata]|uniref:Cyclic nucleotide-binding domain-containing protein n=2 Tax=Rotaria magnacalcarata TaxID=392030 RepID=A0A814M8M7_9BILA|nr:unnamed protein product [Rotaria magnacalcarata]CAF1246223.1 unnamed protein product [Rotaria magnacalcarata]
MYEINDMFDKSSFKITPCEILPIVREFFKQPSGERNIITNVDEIRRNLSDIKPFSRLRTSLQNQILQEAWYECYPEQRAVIRQGARPACFYIILSGTAILTYRRTADDHIETLDVLRRGCTFGDFKAIYMGEDRNCSRDDLKFLKTKVPFLRGFAINALNEFPHAIQNCNYGQSEVIAQDTRCMRHIYIVKSGSLDIWKRLDPDGFVPKLTKYDSDQLKNERMVDDTNDHVAEATAENNALFSEVQISGEVDELNGTNLETDARLSLLRRSKISDEKGPLSAAARLEIIADFEKKFPGITDKRDKLQLIDYDELPINKLNNELTIDEENGEFPNKDPKAREKNALVKRSRSLINTLPKLIFPKKRIYIRIKTLIEGQHFGLNDMLFPNQSALTLVSNKCECLLLLKSSFVRIATDHYKQNIRRTEIPFPSDSDLYKAYHRNEVWKRYSKSVYIDTCQKMGLRQPQVVRRPSHSYQHKKTTTNSYLPEIV